MNPEVIVIPESSLKFALRRWPIISIRHRRSEERFHTTACSIGAMTASVVWKTAESCGVPIRQI
jgi:hypothetical protein